MLGVYLAALAFALVSIGASIFLHDQGDGHAHDGHGEAAHGDLIGTLLSLRFWSYALGAFGMAGAALQALKLPAAVHLPVAIVLGLVVGTGTSWLFQRLRRMASAPLDSEDLLGSEAEVVLPLLPGKVGKVRVRKAEQELELLARCGESETLSPKDRAVVVRFVDGVAEVRAAPWRE